jgi:predicted PhzF superfamily epimerase YddE/YHI9
MAVSNKMRYCERELVRNRVPGRYSNFACMAICPGRKLAWGYAVLRSDGLLDAHLADGFRLTLTKGTTYQVSGDVSRPGLSRKVMRDCSLSIEVAIRRMVPNIFHVNAFCGPTALGNPGAVCLLDDDRPAAWMQMVASQMNLSETGFVRIRSQSEFDLRWFSPTTEVPLCGHVTLGAAHIIWDEARLTDEAVITFQTAGGPLSACRTPDGIEIGLPINRCSEISLPEYFFEAFGVAPVRVLAGRRKHLIELADEAEVVDARPDFSILSRVQGLGVIITARSETTSHDIVSRYFAPYVGVAEDPVTGSAHCCLVPYWSEKLGKNIIRARQASRRGGELLGWVDGETVRLTGKVRVALSGSLAL